MNDYDFRLPGGKVFDTLKEYKEVLSNKADIMSLSLEAAKKESIEETGIILKNVKHASTSKAGLTVEWDLHYFISTEFEKNPKGQELEEEEIIEVQWKTFDEVRKMCLDGSIKEDRTAAFLLRFLEND